MNKVVMVLFGYSAMAFNIPILFSSILVATVTKSFRLTAANNYNQKHNLKRGRRQEHILGEALKI
jgi:hypothetical protein